MSTPPLTLQALNDAPRDQALAMVDGLYEHSPWIAEQALASRPFRSLAQFKHAMATVVRAASREQQLALVRAHPELAGKAMRDNTLTAASTHEQNKAGLTQCTDDELARIAQLNADYAARFGHPFILAVRGPRAEGLSKQEILATFARRLHNHPEVELQEEALREDGAEDGASVLLASEDLAEEAVVGLGRGGFVAVRGIGVRGRGRRFGLGHRLLR